MVLSQFPKTQVWCFIFRFKRFEFSFMKLISFCFQLEAQLGQHKEEKHQLFHTLKKVLYEDETRRRSKEVDIILDFMFSESVV